MRNDWLIFAWFLGGIVVGLIIPRTPTYTPPSKDSVPIWVDVKVPKDAKPGLYRRLNGNLVEIERMDICQDSKGGTK